LIECNEELRMRVQKLKEELNALIVAHNYQRPEIQEISDFVGDSLELSRLCAETDADTLVFCGVRFMAESAAILNPDKRVLLTDMNAGCPMAEMITRRELMEWKKRYSEAAVVCYINSSAEIKAESDCCCTSSNAINVVNSLPENDILFIPDMCLGSYVASHTNKRIILYPGYCSVHMMLKREDVGRARRLYPDAEIMVHPECSPEVTALADQVMGTSQMLYHAKKSKSERFIIGTEVGLMHRLKKENPKKEFIPLSKEAVCASMKRTTIGKVVKTMEQMRNVITVPEEIRAGAEAALDKMLRVSMK
jgi:quinolinate synthase